MSVLVLVKDTEKSLALLRIAHRFAVSSETNLIIATLGKPKEKSELKALSELSGEQFSDDSILSSLFTLQGELEDFDPQLINLAVEDFDTQLVPIAHSVKASLLIVGYHTSNELNASLAQKVFEEANCDTLLLRIGEQADGRKFQKILVPLVGGPHASKALKYAQGLAADGGSLTALYVEPSADDIYRDVGLKRLKSILKEADAENDELIELRVELSDNVESTISKVAAEDFDLMIVGSSRVGSIRRSLFGTLSENLLSGPDGIAVAVFRSQKPLITRLRNWSENILDIVIPQLGRAERVALFDEIEIRSKWNFDFLVLIVLSTIIASLGLLQDSGAVVIGAMLVAPLMTPILGSGLAVLQENVPLFKSSMYAVVFGFLGAFFCSGMLGLIVGPEILTSQMLARTSPSILDVAVGFLSGLAAAHCSARPGLSAALPGVAIAAALVPPIATSGIAFAMGELSHMIGSFLLFFTNVVAIILGAAASFFGGGIRPKEKIEGTSWSLRVSGVLLLFLLGLISFYLMQPRYHGRNLAKPLRETVGELLISADARLKRADVVRGDKGRTRVLLEVTAPRSIPVSVEREILEQLEAEMVADVELVTKTELVSRMSN